MLRCALTIQVVLLVVSCSAQNSRPVADGADNRSTDPLALANVTAVATTGSAGAYTFNVTIKSPDQGCQRYADWWEVTRLTGELLYRRILGHSHVDEQPFTRSGGPVEFAADQQVIVRAHMNPGGYGGQALRGTPTLGFVPDPSITSNFAPALEEAPPLPQSCAF